MIFFIKKTNNYSSTKKSNVNLCLFYLTKLTPMRKSCLILIITFFVYPVSAQNQFEGQQIYTKTVDSLSGKPIEATVTYETLPYGNYTIIAGQTNKNGLLGFKLSEGNGYAFEIKANGFMPKYETITEYTGNDTLVFKLIPKSIDRVIRLETLIFPQGKSTIQPESFKELDDLVAMMKTYPGMEIRLEGHTDFRGSSDQNMILSEKRVIAVKEYLAKKGISPDRIDTRAFGGSNPISKENTEDARRLNRRVEVRILKI